MPTERSFFIVDRLERLTAGLVLAATPVPDLATAGETELARYMLPEGVTQWGEDKLLFTEPSLAVTIELLAAMNLAVEEPGGYRVHATGAQILRDGKDRLLELIMELVRRLEFAELPSRYTSVFAYSSIEAALDFRSHFGQPDDPVWHVRTTGRTHEADARHVNLEPMPLAALGRALSYWRGEFEPDPEPWQRECLLTPPVHVVERI